MRERDRLWAFGCARRGCDGICIVYLLYGKGVLIGGVYLRFVFVVAVAWSRRDSIESGFRFKVNIIKCSFVQMSSRIPLVSSPLTSAY
jgi:hypothetical protein